MVGAIIGKGGAKINEIRQLSGSVIKINEPQDNSNERLVTITGTAECNQMALYMLYSRLGKTILPLSSIITNTFYRKREAPNLRSIISSQSGTCFGVCFQWRTGHRTKIIKADGEHNLRWFLLASYYILQVEDDSQGCIHLRIDNDAFRIPLLLSVVFILCCDSSESALCKSFTIQV